MNEVCTRPLPQVVRTHLDPRATQIAWCAVQATATRRHRLESREELVEALAGTVRILEWSWDPGRGASSSHSSGYALIAGLLAAPPTGARHNRRRRRTDRQGLFGSEPRRRSADAWPRAVLSHGNRPGNGSRPARAGVSDSSPTALRRDHRRRRRARVRALARFDRRLDPWIDFVRLLASASKPIVYQAAFVATTISPGDAFWLEHEAARAAEFAIRAHKNDNPGLARRAVRIRDTLIDGRQLALIDVDERQTAEPRSPRRTRRFGRNRPATLRSRGVAIERCVRVVPRDRGVRPAIQGAGPRRLRDCDLGSRSLPNRYSGTRPAARGRDIPRLGAQRRARQTGGAAHSLAALRAGPRRRRAVGGVEV